MSITPRAFAAPSLLLVLLALTCAVGVAVEDPEPDIAAVLPTGPRTRLAARVVVTGIVCAAALAAVCALAGLSGHGLGSSFVARWAGLAMLAMAVAAVAKRFWSDLPGTVTVAVVLGQAAFLEQYLRAPAFTDSAIWRSTPGRLSLIAVVALATVLLVTQDAGASRRLLTARRRQAAGARHLPP